MKTFLNAAVCTVLAVILALGGRYFIMNVIGLNPEKNTLDEYSDMMLSSRGLFVEYSEQFQLIASQLSGREGLSIIRSGSGKPVTLVDGQPLNLESALDEMGFENSREIMLAAYPLFTGTKINLSDSEGDQLVTSWAKVYSIYVRDGVVEFLTCQHDAGYVGVLYAPGGQVNADYELIELVEDWQIFYVLN